jgi:hypothetical protein
MNLFTNYEDVAVFNSVGDGDPKDDGNAVVDDVEEHKPGMVVGWCSEGTQCGG